METTTLHHISYHSIGSSTDWIVMVVYFIVIMLFGSYFGKYNRSTQDFFFGGRRFSWWLIAFSIVATGVGSHSFVKYSAKGFEHGLSSTMTYINDWFFIPFFLFGWLPIIVYTRIRSIPEYFERRFNPTARFLATLLLLFYMVGYIGIGFLTLGKAAMPLLPESFMLFGHSIPVTLMGVVTLIAIITGIYITFGGQTAVIFTDLLQGFVLLFAGFLLFFLGLDYLGGLGVFWHALPTEWKLPLAKFNKPPDFNFVGIFWQDAVAGSVGFMFMNMGLVMRFMATKSVDEGRKAATFNILVMLPLSAIVVGNAGWIGKAISVLHPDVISPNTSPDQIFVVVANVVSHPGVFGFIMAALTAALMSTVDTLINATSAIYINDIHRPIVDALKKYRNERKRDRDKRELNAARISSVIITALGVVAVLAFKGFPTVYEAHGYFHSTLTPPLVVAIFLGVFWKRFNSAAVITSFFVGVALMLLGANHPAVLIKPFAHGIQMHHKHPYSYIRALYNLVVCSGVGILVVYTTAFQKRYAEKIKQSSSEKTIVYALYAVSALLFLLVALDLLPLWLSLISALVMIFTISILTTHQSKYDEEKQTEGLVIWSIKKAMENFKGGKVNLSEGEKVTVYYKLKEGDEDTVNLSRNDLAKMKANPGDLVYVSDKRKYLGGLKSFHSRIGEPHDEDGVIYITEEHLKQGVLIEGKPLEAELEL